MKPMFKIILLFVAGVVCGTLLSGPLHGFSPSLEDLMTSLVLAPIEMTVGLIVTLDAFPKTAGAMILGALITMATIIPAIVRPKPLFYIALFVGSLLWSLGNIPIYEAFMLV